MKTCLLCGGPPPGLRIIVDLFVCADCLERVQEFSEQGKCFWCRQQKTTGRLPLHYLCICRECRDDYVGQLREAAGKQPVARVRERAVQGRLLEQIDTDGGFEWLAAGERA